MVIPNRHFFSRVQVILRLLKFSWNIEKELPKFKLYSLIYDQGLMLLNLISSFSLLDARPDLIDALALSTAS